jgi:tetratricopeptide (TPR) repeat protein
MKFLSQLAAMLMLSASPAATLATEPKPASTVEADQSESSTAIEAYYEAMGQGEFELALKQVSDLQTEPDNRSGAAILAVMRASALLGLKRDREAQPLLAQANRLAPQDPEVIHQLFFATLLANRNDSAADALDVLIQRAPDKVREIDIELVGHLLRNEPQGAVRRNEDRRINLATIGYGAEFGFGDGIAYEAIGLLVKRGEMSAAMDLLRYVDDPHSIERLLIMRRFEALWPVLEARVGPNLANVRASSAAAAEQAYQADPHTPLRLLELVDALRYAGRYDDAIALRPKLPADSAAMGRADERTGWAVNSMALGLYEVGRADEADQLYELLNGAQMDAGRWRVGTIINRVELLVSAGRFDQALSMMATTEESAAKDGNDYARQLVRRLKYCALSGSGRKEEATRMLPDLMAHAQDAASATVGGLLCGGEIDKAEAVALASLKTEKGEHDFVRALQPELLTSDDPSVWQTRWQELRKRPAIAREYHRLGRDMPKQYLPPPRSRTRGEAATN